MNAEQIIEEVAIEFGYTVDELVGPSKARAVSTARSVAMYAVRKRTDLSFPAIGELFNRDHSTIVTGCGRVEKLMAAHGALVEDASEVERFVDWEAELETLLNSRPVYDKTDPYTTYERHEDAMGLWAIEDVTPVLRRLLGKV